MQDIPLGIHREIKVHVGSIGAERQPILLVDNFIDNAGALVDYAANDKNAYHEKGFYPGIRMELPETYMEFLCTTLGQIICRTFQIKLENVAEAESLFSIVATPTENLKPMQRIPHIDGTNPRDIAFLHYLCDEKYGGTSFYRHKSSGHEYVNQERFAPYIKTLENEINTVGLPVPPRYMHGDTALFERIDSIAAKFNRLIIYRGTSLHSGDISPDYSFDLNPRNGRLTVTSFLYSAI